LFSSAETLGSFLGLVSATTRIHYLGAHKQTYIPRQIKKEWNKQTDRQNLN
jgi:hypothetical protein